MNGLAFEPDLDAAMGRLGRALTLDVSAGDVVDGARNLALFAGWGAVPAIHLRAILDAAEDLERLIGWPSTDDKEFRC